MRIVSPMPSASSVPRPTALFSEPDHFVPASVMPRCSGWSIFSASSRLEAIVFGHRRRLHRDLEVVEVEAVHELDPLGRGGDERLDRVGELELAQVLGQRAGVDADAQRRARGACAASTTSPIFSGPPMLPGLMRTQCAPASIALIASVWLKWMSAITGIGESRTIVFSASTSCSRGTATRTMSAPASATRRIWSIVGREVRRLGLGHRLDGDGRAAPDGNAADVDLPRRGHVRIVRSGPTATGRFRRRLGELGRRRPPGFLGVSLILGGRPLGFGRGSRERRRLRAPGRRAAPIPARWPTSQAEPATSTRCARTSTRGRTIELQPAGARRRLGRSTPARRCWARRSRCR